MKKLIMLMFLLAGTVVYANAQTKKGSPAKLPKKLTTELHLTTDQQTKVNTILAAKAKKIDSLNAIADLKGAKKLKKSINTETDEQIVALLNDDQKKVYNQYDALKKEKAKAKAQVKAGETSNTPPAK